MARTRKRKANPPLVPPQVVIGQRYRSGNRWRGSAVSGGVRRSGLYASEPKEGEFFFDRGGRLRRAEFNRRGRIVGRSVPMPDAPTAVQVLRFVQIKWAAAVHASPSEIPTHVQSLSRSFTDPPGVEWVTYLDLEVRKRSHMLTNEQWQRILDSFLDSSLADAMNALFPGVSIAKKYMDPLEDRHGTWSGQAATATFTQAVRNASAMAEKAHNSYGKRDQGGRGSSNSLVAGCSFVLFHQ